MSLCLWGDPTFIFQTRPVSGSPFFLLCAASPAQVNQTSGRSAEEPFTGCARSAGHVWRTALPEHFCGGAGVPGPALQCLVVSPLAGPSSLANQFLP